MSQNYYEELIEKIKKLIIDKKNDEALEMINNEFKLPYIPKIYENELISLKKQIDPQEPKKPYLFSRDELITIMNEYKKHDANFLIDIAIGFEQYNWINYEKEIQKIFNLSIGNNIKSIIYNSLVLQQMNHDFLIDNVAINPFKNKTIFETEFAIKNHRYLLQKNIKDPSIIDLSEKIFFIYLMATFPSSLFLKFEDISDKILSIAQVMIGEKDVKNLEQKTLKMYNIINGKE